MMDAVLIGAAVAVMGDAVVMVNSWRWGGGYRAVIDAALAAESQVFKGRYRDIKFQVIGASYSFRTICLFIYK